MQINHEFDLITSDDLIVVTEMDSKSSLCILYLILEFTINPFLLFNDLQWYTCSLKGQLEKREVGKLSLKLKTVTSLEKNYNQK